MPIRQRSVAWTFVTTRVLSLDPTILLPLRSVGQLRQTQPDVECEQLPSAPQSISTIREPFGRSTSASLVYDGDGNRVQETVAGVVTRYLTGEVNPTGYVQVMAELNLVLSR